MEKKKWNGSGKWKEEIRKSKKGKGERGLESRNTIDSMGW